MGKIENVAFNRRKEMSQIESNELTVLLDFQGYCPIIHTELNENWPFCKTAGKKIAFQNVLN